MIQSYRAIISNTELRIPQLATRTNHFDVERFASCVFCGGHTVFCVVVVTKVKDSYLMNKTFVLAPADGWLVDGRMSETRQLGSRCSLLHDLIPEANQTKFECESYF